MLLEQLCGRESDDLRCSVSSNSRPMSASSFVGLAIRREVRQSDSIGLSIGSNRVSMTASSAIIGTVGREHVVHSVMRVVAPRFGTTMLDSLHCDRMCRLFDSYYSKMIAAFRGCWIIHCFEQFAT
jgi:hypothetical protein